MKGITTNGTDMEEFNVVIGLREGVKRGTRNSEHGAIRCFVHGISEGSCLALLPKGVHKFVGFSGGCLDNDRIPNERKQIVSAVGLAQDVYNVDQCAMLGRALCHAIGKRINLYCVDACDGSVDSFRVLEVVLRACTKRDVVYFEHDVQCHLGFRILDVINCFKRQVIYKATTSGLWSNKVAVMLRNKDPTLMQCSADIFTRNLSNFKRGLLVARSNYQRIYVNEFSRHRKKLNDRLIQPCTTKMIIKPWVIERVSVSWNKARNLMEHVHRKKEKMKDWAMACNVVAAGAGPNDGWCASVRLYSRDKELRTSLFWAWDKASAQHYAYVEISIITRWMKLWEERDVKTFDLRLVDRLTMVNWAANEGVYVVGDLKLDCLDELVPDLPDVFSGKCQPCGH